MNKRIQKLFNEAGFHQPEMERLGIEDKFKKFAELIVEECCDVLQNEDIRHSGYGYNQGFLHKKIKEHFGVEE